MKFKITLLASAFICLNTFAGCQYIDKTNNSTCNTFYAIPKTLYAWNPTEVNKVKFNGSCIHNWEVFYKDSNSIKNLLIFAGKFGFNHINIFIGSAEYYFNKTNSSLPFPSGLENILTSAKNAKIGVTLVWYLDDTTTSDKLKQWPQWGTNFANAILSYNKSHASAPITSVQFDQEPKNKAYFANYIKTLQNVQTAFKGKNVKSSATISPQYIGSKFSDLYKKIIDNTDYSLLMDYIKSATFNTDANDVMNYASSKNKKADIAIETGFVNMTSSDLKSASYACDIIGDIKNKTANFYKNVIGKYNTVHSNKGFNQIAIHDYSQFYFDLTGKYPYSGDACSEVPKAPSCPSQT